MLKKNVQTDFRVPCSKATGNTEKSSAGWTFWVWKKRKTVSLFFNPDFTVDIFEPDFEARRRAMQEQRTNQTHEGTQLYILMNFGFDRFSEESESSRDQLCDMRHRRGQKFSQNLAQLHRRSGPDHVFYRRSGQASLCAWIGFWGIEGCDRWSRDRRQKRTSSDQQKCECNFQQKTVQILDWDF